MTFSANLVHAVVNIPMKSGIVKDSVENNLHYLAPGPISGLSDGDFDNLRDAIKDFYIGSITGGVGSSLTAYMGDEISNTTNACSIKFYEVPTGGGHEGAPIVERFFSMSGMDNNTLPEEVACVLSFRVDYGTDVEFSGSTRPRARDRNRIYVSPLSSTAKTQDSTTKRVKPSDGLLTDIRLAAKQYLSAAAADNNWDWRVVSHRALRDSTVQFVAVDNAFDTQRRRGPAPSSRLETAL